MEKEAAFLFTAHRWNILESIAAGNTSATPIAKKLDLSLAYVNTQLKLLAAAGWLKQEKAREKKVGKPRHDYAINKELVIIGAINPREVSLNQIKPAKRAQFIVSTLFQQNEQDLYFLQKFYYQHEEFIMNTSLMALLETKDNETHFLTIGEDVENIRKKHSNIILKNPEGKERKIVIWSHTKEEIEQGLKNNEQYYVEKIRKAKPFWEHGTSLEQYKKLLEETTP
ncbi:hypothetical protein JXA12_05035 [Candidatus Woesearchaeota archaeon]|nr:hypothetical protein [Candidatus Woesearchaeota archaeon]